MRQWHELNEEEKLQRYNVIHRMLLDRFFNEQVKDINIHTNDNEFKITFTYYEN